MFKTSINGWLQGYESDVEAVIDCLKYKIGIHPALLDYKIQAHAQVCECWIVIQKSGWDRSDGIVGQESVK